MDEMPRAGRWQQFLGFHRTFLTHPWQALLLALLSGGAGLALVLDWTGHSTARPHWRVEHWIAAVLWWIVGGYCAVVAVMGLRRRE
jgi:hypothetical protein